MFSFIFRSISHCSFFLMKSELRTPLNAAHAGMQLLQADLSLSVRPEDIERLDTLNDVTLSITTTVDIRKYSHTPQYQLHQSFGVSHCNLFLLPFPIILVFSVNDLLSFEKMEAGLMTLHKSDVHVQHFVESTVDIFYATARGKGITIKVENRHCHLT